MNKPASTPPSTPISTQITNMANVMTCSSSRLQVLEAVVQLLDAFAFPGRGIATVEALAPCLFE
jgi:hypothetical protein